MNFNRKGQLAIFIIIGIIIVAGIVIYFVAREKVGVENIPTEFLPVYDYYSSCIQEAASVAISLAGVQGGHIYTDTYIPGSEYAPFSNQLNFLGFPVPYWYYISGNGIVKENVPTKKDIENEISRYVNDKIKECDFDSFYAQGFDISFGEADVSVIIQDDKVDLIVRNDVAVSKEDSSARKIEHKVSVNSKLGSYYNIAKEIYDKQKKEAFLENYAIDVLRLYAPVDGVEISCSPKIWKTREVIDDIRNNLEQNIATLKFKSNNYDLKDEKRKYFVIDKEVLESVNLLYSKNWPTKIEIFGGDDELMIAKPVGNQEGLGIMGFCYEPYHFVYDLSFPVLVQIYNNEEVFQFPVVVKINKNSPREPIYSEITEDEKINLCEFKTQDVEINVYDTQLNKINANLSYGCFNEMCSLGETQNGKFIGKAPGCLNGYLEVKANGYREKKQLLSTNEEKTADVILDKEYELGIELEVGGKPLEGTALVSFAGDNTQSIALPEINKIKLTEGLYNVSVFVYGNSSITIPGSTKTQCTQVGSSGIFGLFGATREECFDIKLPESKIDYALIGGGKSEIYILEDELVKGKMKIKVDGLGKPNSIEDLQNNFVALDGMEVNIEYG